VEDQYHSKDEYNKLTAEQNEALHQKCSKRGHKPGEKSSKVLEKDAKKQKDGQIRQQIVSLQYLCTYQDSILCAENEL
jgi:hypothetical protein